MKTPHKHAEFIKAWADGAEIEFCNQDPKEWRLAKNNPNWDENTEYRIKPEPKPDVVRYGVAIIDDGCATVFAIGQHNQRLDNNLKLTFDGTTNKLIKAEVI